MDNTIKITKHNRDTGVDLSRLDDSQAAAITSTEDKVMLRAPAGSGKTWSIINAIIQYRYENLNDRICAITYTRAARAEMEARLQEAGIYDVEVTTIHVWARNLLYDFSIKYDFQVKILEEPHIKAILKEIINDYHRKTRTRLVNEGIAYSYIMGNKNMEVSDKYRNSLAAIERRYIAYKRNAGLYDFTDYPLYLYDVLKAFNESINNIGALFVDEYQDVDEVQFELFKKVNAHKKFFVGDAWQCQPAGAKVLVLQNGKACTKDIAQLTTEDQILACRGDGVEVAKIKTIQKHLYYDADLVTVGTKSGLRSSYTNNHRALVKFNKTAAKGYAVYLSCTTENYFKLGIAPLKNIINDKWHEWMTKSGNTRLWILQVCESKYEARTEGLRKSLHYRIPFIDKKKLTEEEIAYICNELKTFFSAMLCLRAHRLDVKYPLFDVNKKVEEMPGQTMEIFALNLMPKIMKIIAVESNGTREEMIETVEKQYCPSPIEVYALEVEGGIYIADGILTHNSIFVFRGADGEVFTKTDDFHQYKLRYNYRSYQEIIDYAVTVYNRLLPDVREGVSSYISSVVDKESSDIKCVRGEGGYVYVGDPYGRFVRMFKGNIDRVERDLVFKDMLPRKPMILCRTNKQVAAINSLGYFNCSTIHQAKGLEYDNVIVIETTIKDMEDLNIAYVALTRAKNRVFVVNWNDFETWFNRYLYLTK